MKIDQFRKELYPLKICIFREKITFLTITCEETIILYHRKKKNITKYKTHLKSVSNYDYIKHFLAFEYFLKKFNK